MLRLHAKLSTQIGLNSSNLSRRSLKRIIPKSASITILDIGANVGQFSKLCRREFKEALIIAIEPQDLCHVEILKNSGINTIVIGKVVSSEVGFVSFEISEDKDRKGHIVNGWTQTEPIEPNTYEQTTVDEIMKEYKIESLNLLKIDTEGNDYEVLKGAKTSLSQGKVGNILFEIMPRLISHRTTPSEIERYLREFGYNFFYRSTPHLGLMKLEHLVDYELHTQNIITSKVEIK